MRSFIVLAAFMAALGGVPAFAEDSAQREAVRIEKDQAAKAFIFIIDDEPVAMLGKDGLRVVGSVEYGGTLTDSGAQHIKDTITGRKQEASHE